MKLFYLLLLSVNFLSASAKEVSAEKILLIRVDEIGVVTVNQDTVAADVLAIYIQERLFKSFLGTGQMHSRIKLEKTNNSVADLVTEVIIKEINEAQKRALRQVCVEKFNKNFDGLEKRKQDKLKKQFPVLFQTNYL